MEKRSHRIGDFNILSNQGNQKNIRVSLSGRNNADSGLFAKKLERFPDYRVMLDIPSQYMHYCLVLLCEVYCAIV